MAGLMKDDSKTSEVRPILTLLGSNVLGLMVGGVFFLLASWYFDLVQMGLYSVAISIQGIVAGFLGTGLGVASIRVSSGYLAAGERSAAAGVIALAYTTAAFLSLGIAAACMGLPYLVSRPLFLPAKLLVLVVLWAGARSMIECLRSGLLAQQDYPRIVMLMVLSAVTGLMSLGLIFLVGPLTVHSMLVAHFLGLGSCALLGSWLLLPLIRSGVHMTRSRLTELLKYARWPALSEGASLLTFNIGPLILVAVAGSDQAGLFTLGRYPAYLFGVVSLSFYQYWLPKASKENERVQLIRFLRRQMRLAALVGIVMLVCAVICRPLLPLLGENFGAAASLFLLNTVDFTLILLVRPIETVFHGMYRPQLELALQVIRLLLLVALACGLAPGFGALGMVGAHVVSSVVVLGVAFWLFLRQVGSFTHPGQRILSTDESNRLE